MTMRGYAKLSFWNERSEMLYVRHSERPPLAILNTAIPVILNAVKDLIHGSKKRVFGLCFCFTQKDT